MFPQEEQSVDVEILQVKEDLDHLDFVKAELNEEDDVARLLEGDDDDNDSDLELSKVKELIKTKADVKQNLKEEEYSEDEEDQYESYIIQTYTSATVKEEPIEDFKLVFKENNLEYEKQKYYQQILEKIMKTSDQIKLKDLQSRYIARLRQASNIGVYTCSFCPYQTINITNLKCHLMVIHNKKTTHKMFRCKTCRYEHDFRIIIKKHLAIHQNLEPESIFSCQKCNYIGPSKRSLKSHMKKQHTEEKTPRCDLCGFLAKDSKSLKKHMGTHRVPGSHRYKCFKCDHEVANKMKMARHLLKVHQIDNERIQKLQDVKCDQCPYVTDSVHRLKQHVLIHKNPEEIDYFYCDKCSFKCKLKHGLKKHMVVMHTDKSERVFSQMCDKCSYKCERPSMLKLHMLSHMDKSEISESELHKCPHCPFMGKTKGNLKSHMYSHADKTFKCDLCGFETKRQRNYKEHKKLHMKSSELQIYKCDFCPYQTKFKPCLVNHMKQGDHSGRNLKHIPHKFRIENADKPDFDPTEVRFGPPKKYPKYPKKNKDEPRVSKAFLQAQTKNANVEPNNIAMPNNRTYGWGERENLAGSSGVAGEIFLNFVAGQSRYRY